MKLSDDGKTLIACWVDARECGIDCPDAFPTLEAAQAFCQQRDQWLRKETDMPF